MQTLGLMYFTATKITRPHV